MLQYVEGMNAIFSLDTATSSGGGQVILRTLAKDLTPTVLFCPAGSLADQAERYCKVVRINKPRLTPASISELRKTMARFAPIDTLHIHGISALTLGILASEGLVKQREYTEHLLTKHYKLESRLHYWIQLVAYRWFIKRVNHVYCVSAAVMQFLRESLRIPSSKLSITYNPVPKLASITSEKGTKRSQNKKVELVSIGSLSYVKNYVQLLHIIGKLPRHDQIHVTIFGDGAEKNDLEALSSHLGLSPVITFAGALPHDQLIEKLFSADIYVQTSISESFGYGIAEAMQTGLPVVAFAVGGIPELVQDEYSGKLIPPYNELKFVEAIQELIDNKAYRQQLGKNAKDSIARYET